MFEEIAVVKMLAGRGKNVHKTNLQNTFGRRVRQSGNLQRYDIYKIIATALCHDHSSFFPFLFFTRSNRKKEVTPGDSIKLTDLYFDFKVSVLT